MADTIRERILQALETQLKTITTANGYEYSFATVERYRAVFFEDELPAIGIHDGTEETTLMHGKAHQAMTVRLSGIVAQGALNRSVALNKLRGDLKKAIRSGDTTFGGLADRVYIAAFEPRIPTDDEEESVQGSLDVVIEFYEDIEDPYV